MWSSSRCESGEDRTSDEDIVESNRWGHRGTGDGME
jgi:hypothetical protein